MLEITQIPIFILISIIGADGYFGLTGKGQLRDVWNLRSSSLASVIMDSEARDLMSSEPEPSTDYKPVNLGPEPLPASTLRKAGNANSIIFKDVARQPRLKKKLNGQKSSRNRYFNRRLNQKRPQNYQNQRKSAQSLSYSFANINTSSNSSDSLNKLYKTIKAKNSTLQRKERESGRRRLFFGDRFYVFHPSLSQTQLISGVSYSNHKTGHLIKHQRIDLQNHSSEGNEPHSRFKFFGIEDSERTSYAAFMNSKYNMQPMREPKDIDTKAAKKWCDNFKLTSLQRKKCRRDAGLPQVLAEATQIAAAECQYQFRYERWNCSLGTSRIRLLDKGNKETAFLFAISSAGLAYSVSRACSSGHLERCSCEGSLKEASEEWMWGGCGDNLLYAAKFARRFLKSRSRSHDVRAEMDKHNSNLGIKFVKSNVERPCKCHGVSGSCTTKSCWRKMAPFEVIGKKIKRAYDKAVKVRSVNNANGKSHLIRLRRSKTKPHQVDILSQGPMLEKRGQSNLARKPSLHNVALQGRTTKRGGRIARPSGEPPKHKEMVFIENSPSYCSKNRFSSGVKGRVCDNKKKCDKLCCGHGYNTHVRILRKSCNCKVHWCCKVQCEVCTEKKLIHTCL